MFGVFVAAAVVCLVLAVLMFRSYAANRKPSRLAVGIVLGLIVLAGTVYTVLAFLLLGAL